MRAVIEGASWFLAGVIVWLATVASIAIPEVLIAVLTSAAVAPFAVLARRQMGLHVRPSADWVRWALIVPVAAVADTARLVAWMLGRAADAPEAEAIVARHAPAGEHAAAVGWRAGATCAISATPGSLVVDTRADGRLLLHRLVTGAPNLDERATL